MSRPRLVALLCIVAALSLLAAWLLRSTEPDMRPLSLPTGEVVLLRGWSYGTNHIAPGAPLRRLIPAKLRPWMDARFPSLRSRFSDQTTPEASLVLWMEVLSQASTNAPPELMTSLQLADVEGTAAGEIQHLGLRGNPGPFTQTAVFPAVPVRSGDLRVQWLQGTYDKPSQVGEWRIKNPGFSTSPSWTPETLPSSRRSGTLDFTVKQVVFGVDNSVRQEGSGSIRLQAPRASRRVSAAIWGSALWNGTPATNWSFSKLVLRDPAGQRFSGSSMSQSRSGTNMWAIWDPCLWPDTWQLDFELKRDAGAQYEANELLEFRDVDLSGKETTQLQATGSCAGVRIRLSELTIRQESVDSPTKLKVVFSGLPQGIYADFIHLADESGRRYTSSMWSSQIQGGTEEREYGIPELTNIVPRVSVLFAVHRGYAFSFKIRPAVVVTNCVLLP